MTPNSSQLTEKSKLFSHYLHWAPFVICGTGCEIHPSELIEPKSKSQKNPQSQQNAKEASTGFFSGLFGSKSRTKIHIDSEPETKSLVTTDLTMVSDNELREEARILRSEGGIDLADAAEAELRRRRQAKVDEVKKR
jgi:hypothetical protein